MLSRHGANKEAFPKRLCVRKSNNLLENPQMGKREKSSLWSGIILGRYPYMNRSC